MSETTKVTENTTTPVEDTFTLNVDANEPFSPIEESMFIDTNKLCSLVSVLMRPAFPDFYGSSFEVIPGTNNYMIALYFDHIDRGDCNETAVTKNSNDSSANNKTLRATRNYANRLREGDRYHITKKGSDIISELLYSPKTIRASIYEGNPMNPVPKWSNICGEVSENTYGAVPRQLTKVSYLDPVKLIEKIYGTTTADGKKYEYGVELKRSLPGYTPSGVNTNFMLRVGRVTVEEVINLANQFGFQYSQNLNIIR